MLHKQPVDKQKIPGKDNYNRYVILNNTLQKNT